MDENTPVERFEVCSVVRGRKNRTLRATQPVHHRFKQHVTSKQYRLVRGRPVALSRQEVDDHIDELIAKEEAGILVVRALPGHRLVHLKGLKDLIGKPLPAELFDPAPPPPPDVEPVTPVDEMNVGLGKDFIPPFEGAKPVLDEDGDDTSGVPPTIDRTVPAVEEAEEMTEETPPEDELEDEADVGEDIPPPLAPKKPQLHQPKKGNRR